jgi:hypothetical protein
MLSTFFSYRSFIIVALSEFHRAAKSQWLHLCGRVELVQRYLIPFKLTSRSKSGPTVEPIYSQKCYCLGKVAKREASSPTLLAR